MSARLEELAQAFEVFAEYDTAGASPLYERLAMAIAADEELLAIAAEARHLPLANLFLGAIQLRLFSVPEDPLAAFYASLNPAAGRLPDDPELPAILKQFCLRERDAIVEVLHNRRVQTNEPRRSIYLLLLLNAVQRLHPGRPLALVEVGSAAGLNLLFDRYSYAIGGRRVEAPAGSPLTLSCEVVGEPPPLPEQMLTLSDRAGIDLHPLDVSEPADVEWLRALVWPEQEERRHTLDVAVAIAQEEPPEVLAGDALDLLPAVIHGLPKDAWICVYDSFTLGQMDGSDRARFGSMLEDLSRERPLAWISAEMNGVVMAAPRAPAPGRHRRGTFFGVLGMNHFGPRGSIELALGFGDGHASWVEWLNPDI